MPRPPKPYRKNGWFVTSFGGVKHRKLCPVDDGKRKAKDILATMLAPAAAAERHVGPSERAAFADITVLAVLRDFLDFKRAEHGSGSLAYRDYVARLKPFETRFGCVSLRSLSEVQGLEYRAWLHREREWRRNDRTFVGMKPAAVNSKIRAAKTFLNWVADPKRHHQYALAYNPWKDVDLLPERSRERIITDDEFKSLLENCTDGNVSGGAVDFREALSVMRHTTMRPGELRLLRWDYIQWAGHRIVYPLDVIKTRRRRSVTMLPVVEQVLLGRKKRLEAAGIKPDGAVFPSVGKNQAGKRTANAADRPIKCDSFSQRFRRLVQRCVAKGLIEHERAGERLVLYSTRHTRITELFVEGNDTAIAMQEAGHAIPSTTERYKHLAPGFITSVIRQRAGQKLAANNGVD